MWNKDELEGKADQLKGRMKEKAGELSDDDRLRDEGAADQVSGGVQEAFGKGRRKVGEALSDLGKEIKK
jgi:uncharacterized protein YjbJ (UPF0337 family)